MRALLTSLSTLFSLLFDFVAPARPSLRLIRGATLSDVLARQNKDGSLPYHDPLVRALVWEIKYYANPHALRLCGHILGERLFDLASEELGTPLLIPIPMHPKRRNERGHNQTELLCEAALTYIEKPEIMKKMVWPAIGSGRDGRSENLFGRISGFEYAPNILIKQKQTPQQQGLPQQAQERAHDEPRNAPGRLCKVRRSVRSSVQAASGVRRRTPGVVSELLQGRQGRRCCISIVSAIKHEGPSGPFCVGEKQRAED
jgi:hypothetical protein